MIRKSNAGYTVYARTGRKMGTYRTQAAALRRKQQLEANSAKLAATSRRQGSKSPPRMFVSIASGQRAFIRSIIGDNVAIQLVPQGSHGFMPLASFKRQYRPVAESAHSWPGQPRRHAKAAALGHRRAARSPTPDWVWISTEDGSIWIRRSGGVTLRRLGFGEQKSIYVPKLRFDSVFVRRKATETDRMFMHSPTQGSPSSEVRGKRVQLHPGTSQWMQGDRYGTVTRANRDGSFQVKMDRSGRSLKVSRQHIGEWM
jgi:hypothetical protein